MYIVFGARGYIGLQRKVCYEVRLDVTGVCICAQGCKKKRESGVAYIGTGPSFV